MSEHNHCQVCGKPAIGMQVFGCCSSTVCKEHADRTLLAMKPGEKGEFGTCYFWRFSASGE